ncbi:hypothetical protein ACKFKG_10660 [Phormidesmis sp. 146-35]
MFQNLWYWVTGRPDKRNLLAEKRKAAQPMGIRTQSIAELLNEWEEQLDQTDARS